MFAFYISFIILGLTSQFIKIFFIVRILLEVTNSLRVTTLEPSFTSYLKKICCSKAMYLDSCAFVSLFAYIPII